MAIQECMTVLGRLLWMLEWRLKRRSTLGEGKEEARGHGGRRNEYQLWDTFSSVMEFKARNVSIKG
jgi:hypothetical protein